MFLLHHFNLLAIVRAEGVELSFGAIRLKQGYAQGTFTTAAYNPLLVKQYQGFEVLLESSQVEISTIDAGGRSHSWDGALWQLGEATNTPEQVREGLPRWVGSIQFKVILSRPASGLSPSVSAIKVGAEVSGNGGSIRSYILSYALPALLSDPVELTRWVDDPVEAPVGVSLVNIISRESKPFGLKHLLSFRYQCLVENLYSEYQVSETPCLLLQAQSTRNHREMNEVDSIRLPDDRAKLSSLAMVCDQSIEVTVIAQNPDDVAAICEHIVQIVETRNYVELPPYALQIGCTVGGIRMDEPVLAITEGQLPSAIMEIVLYGLPLGMSEVEVGILIGVEKLNKGLPV